MRKATAWRHAEVMRGKAPNSAKQQVYNMAAAFGALAKLDNIGDGVPIRQVLLSGTFEESLERLRSSLDNPFTRKKYCAELRRLREYALVVTRSDGLPRQFSAALGELIRRQDCSVNDIARRASIDIGLLHSWLNGSQPLTKIAEVSRLEAVLAVEPTTLTAALHSRNSSVLCCDILTPALKGKLFNKSLPLSVLPDDWALMTSKAKSQTLEWLTKNILEADPYRLYLSGIAAAQVRHPPLSKAMAADFSELVTFKTSDVPTPSIPRRKKATGSRRRQKVTDGRWDLSSVETIESGLKKVVSALQTAVAARTNGRGEWNPLCGLGIFVNSECVRAAFACIAAERYKRLEEVGALESMDVGVIRNNVVYAEIDASLCRIIAGWFEKETGYFTHRPRHLDPVPGLLDETFIKQATADWVKAATTAYTEMSQIADDIEAAAKQIRNPWFRIEPIISRDDPLTPLFDAIELLASHRPGLYSSPVSIAYHDRQQLIVHLLLNSRLRASNVRELTWRKDNKGQLRQDKDGTWIIVLRQELLKNAGSSALPPNGEDVVIELDKEDATLYKALDNYLLGLAPTRNVLLTGKPTNVLFPGLSKNGVMTEQNFYKVVAHFTASYLVKFPWRDGGIEGVLPFGPHAIRHLVATHVIKTTGTVEAAANALLDSVETLRKTYARFLTRDKSRLTNRIIRESLRRGG